MKKLIIVLIMLILFISVSAVSASGNFTSLQEDIEDSENSIVLTQDYVYDNTTDDEIIDGIEIDTSNFAFNGNGHTIDAKSQSRIFDISGYNITISNLKIINGKNIDNGGAVKCVGNITLINLTFVNCSASSGGAINCDGNIILINSTFENNRAATGGAIISTGKLDVINSTFSANSAKMGGALITTSSATFRDCTFKDFTNITFSMIYGDKQSNVIIENSTFLNSRAKYATAVYGAGNTLIKKSTFKNLRANETGGAVAVKYGDKLEIDSCTFEDTISVKNGGAVYIDGDDDEEKKHTKVIISNNKFVNTSGDFGGAVLGLGINTVISNNSFEKCSSIYDGGAIYLSQSPSASIIGNNFTDNMIINEGDGAAIYLFETSPTIRQSTFINNKDNAVYVYSCKNVTVDESIFINNTVAIYGVFSNVTYTNTSFAKDNLSLNNTDYAIIVEEEGMHPNIINNTVDVVNPPARFDLREWGWVTPVKNQGEMGACWTFGTIAALESALLKATGIAYDLSENNVQDNMLKFSKYGSKDVSEGSREEEGLIYLLSWRGVIPTKYDTFDELGKISPLIATNESFHIQDAIMVSRSSYTENDAIKRAIMKYGAIATSYSHDPDYYNEKTYSYYQYESVTSDHVIAVVGWDDNFPASNFKETPPGNGAFIIKNSWGTEFGDKGYMYISYYDPSILTTSSGIAYILENTENYTKNYETDLGGVLYFTGNGDEPLKYQNNYESTGNELISAIGTYFHLLDKEYTLEIYVNGELKYHENAKTPYYGYHTIKLSKEIPIAKGDNVSLVMTKNKVPSIFASMQHFMKNTSLVTKNNVTTDEITENATVSLKMYTKNLAIYSKDLVKIYKNDSQFEVNVGSANQTVVFEINGNNYTRVSNENGTARMNINLRPGDYVIRTTYDGTTVENTIKVLPTLIADDLVKHFRNESQFYISLIDGAGKAIPNVNITMNINGVFYNRTTNENGTAKLNINLEPGEYILTAIDPLTGLEMSYNITVLPVLTADDINMTYLDGSKFTATLVDGEGNALEGVNITFNINGVFYKRTTDENGTARLNIRLMPGEYIITSQYGQAAISNKITIIAKED